MILVILVILVDVILLMTRPGPERVSNSEEECTTDKRFQTGQTLYCGLSPTQQCPKSGQKFAENPTLASFFVFLPRKKSNQLLSEFLVSVPTSFLSFIAVDI